LKAIQRVCFGGCTESTTSNPLKVETPATTPLPPGSHHQPPAPPPLHPPLLPLPQAHRHANQAAQALTQIDAGP